jgi:DNA-binding PadR family transcriptional regulator
MVKVARVLLADPDRLHYGYDLRREAQVLTGTLYPLLRRLVGLGWLTDGWEDSVPDGRPRRRYYRLTELGRVELARMLERGNGN